MYLVCLVIILYLDGEIDKKSKNYTVCEVFITAIPYNRFYQRIHYKRLNDEILIFEKRYRVSKSII